MVTGMLSRKWTVAGSHLILAILVVGAAGLLSGCASGPLGKVGVEGSIPDDLQERFEVTDATPAPVPTQAQTGALPVADQPLVPTPAAQGAPAKNKKKKKSKKELQAEKAALNAAANTSSGAELKGPFVYPSRRPAKDPIGQGEKHVFDITYFGMNAGDFTLEVMPNKMINQRQVYHVRGHAVSSKMFNMFYRLNDVVETFFDYEGFFSHRFQMDLDESKQTRKTLELFDSEKGEVYYWNRRNHKDKGLAETKESQPMTPFPQDSISALYYMRTVPLPTGAVFTFPMVSQGKTWDAVVTVVKRETIQTVLGRVKTVVVKPETKYQGILQKKGDSHLWLTDDENRYIVRLEAKVKIGTVVANLKKLEAGNRSNAQASGN